MAYNLLYNNLNATHSAVKICWKLPSLLKTDILLSLIAHQPVRYARKKHWTPKFRIMNQYQPWRAMNPSEMSEFTKEFKRSDPSEIRQAMQSRGLLPPVIYRDQQINISSTNVIFDEYVPPKLDGKASSLSLRALSQQTSKLMDDTKMLNARRKIRKYEETFTKKAFVQEATAKYEEAHQLLQNHRVNDARLLEIVTEKALSEMTHGLHLKTLRWELRQHLDAPRVVCLRTQPGLIEGQLFAQATVRFFSEQIIAVYDRFGRLMLGWEDRPIEMLEYVVFEKQISEEWSSWRMHAKILPDWLQRRVVSRRTRFISSSPAPPPTLPGVDTTTSSSSVDPEKTAFNSV